MKRDWKLLPFIAVVFLIVFAVRIFNHDVPSDVLKSEVQVLTFFSVLVAILRGHRITSIAPFVVVAVMWLHVNTVRTSESAAFRDVAQIARRTAEPTRRGAVSASWPFKTGKVMIWDVGEDRLSEAYYRVPQPLRAKPDDRAMTIFLIWGSRSLQNANYFVKKTDSDPVLSSPFAPAYRDIVDIGVVRWPDRTLVQWHAVVADSPQEITAKKSEKGKPVHADSLGAIVDWIRSMEKVR